MQKSKPILFSPAMVTAILEGRKVQTRRAINLGVNDDVCTKYGSDGENDMPPWPVVDGEEWMKCPYGSVDDSLWIRETHYRFGHWKPLPGIRTKMGRQKWAFIPDSTDVLYDAPAEYRKGRHHKDSETPAWHKRLARFMPRSLCRINLEITDIRVERLTDISNEDAKAEGFPGKMLSPHGTSYPKIWFRQLWQDINGRESWEKNPWVWVICFKVLP